MCLLFHQFILPLCVIWVALVVKNIFESSVGLNIGIHTWWQNAHTRSLSSCYIILILYFKKSKYEKLLTVSVLQWNSLYPVVRFANFKGICSFSVLSIILTDLLGNTCLFAWVQKVLVCDSCLVDFDPFCLFHVSSLFCVSRLWSSCFRQ